MAQSEKKAIVIIGGGIIGSTTAYFLTRHPKYNPTLHSIHLLEATSIAGGASGKAGGLLGLWAYPSCIVPLSFKLHAELAKEHNGTDRWGYRGVGCAQIDFVGQQISSQRKQRSNGDLKGLNSNGDVSLQKRSKESYSALQKMGVPDDLDWVVEECVRGYDRMGTPQNTAQVHPYQFTTSMAKLAEEKGVKIILGTVDDISKGTEGKHKVNYTEKDSGEKKSLDATDVVVTAGPWTGRVWPGAPIGGLRAHSVTIRPSRPVSAYALFTQIALPKNFKDGVSSRAEYVSPEIYARPNNELYACGEGDHFVSLPKTTADVEVDDSRCQDIIDHCSSISDELKNGEVLVRQACYLPQVESGGGPLIGPTNTKGVWMAAGHTCWGIQNAPATGKLMSEFVFDGKTSSANVSSLDPRKTL